jgi:aspartyl-tRNA(Asn)/glutamyl-tRNA(Gln) amidotransferase subunit A
MDDDVAQALDGFLARIEAAGHAVVETSFPPITELNNVAAVITGFEAAALHAEVLAARPEFYPETIRRRILAAACIPETDYAAALRLRGTYLRDVLAGAFARADFLVCPVLPTGGARLDVLADPEAAGRVARAYLTLNRPVNLLGLPSLTIPAGRDQRGIPIGLQIIGPPLADRAILSFAAL